MTPRERLLEKSNLLIKTKLIILYPSTKELSVSILNSLILVSKI